MSPGCPLKVLVICPLKMTTPDRVLAALFHVERFMTRHWRAHEVDGWAEFEIALEQENSYSMARALCLVNGHPPHGIFDRRPFVVGDRRMCRILGKLDVVDTSVADGLRLTGRFAMSYTLDGVSVSDDVFFHLETLRHSIDPMSRYVSLYWLVSNIGVDGLYDLETTNHHSWESDTSCALRDLGLK